MDQLVERFTILQIKLHFFLWPHATLWHISVLVASWIIHHMIKRMRSLFLITCLLFGPHDENRGTVPKIDYRPNVLQPKSFQLQPKRFRLQPKSFPNTLLTGYSQLIGCRIEIFNFSSTGKVSQIPNICYLFFQKLLWRGCNWVIRRQFYKKEKVEAGNSNTNSPITVRTKLTNNALLWYKHAGCSGTCLLEKNVKS